MPRSTIHPLADYPEFSIIEHPGCREYRIRKVFANNATSFSNFAMITLCFALGLRFLSGISLYVFPILVALIFVGSTLFSVLYESIILLPPHGIQLETHHGSQFFGPLFSSRRFVPSTSLDGVVINEGLNGWNVLYYLALVQRPRSQAYEMEVVFRKLLPPHSVLLQVFEGIHDIVLFSPQQKKKAQVYIK